MCPETRWSTSSCCGSERRRLARSAAVAVLLIAASAPFLAPEARSASSRSTTPRPIVLVTLTTESGEREVEAKDVRFVYYKTSYKRTRAPKDEVPGGERTEVVAQRDECQCVRFLDWSKVKMKRIREIAVTHDATGRVATVRVTRRDGGVNEYPATALYGGDGLYPPLFAVTIEGAHREFPLIVPGHPDAQWPEEELTRILWTTTTPPPKPKKGSH